MVKGLILCEFSANLKLINSYSEHLNEILLAFHFLFSEFRLSKFCHAESVYIFILDSLIDLPDVLIDEFKQSFLVHGCSSVYNCRH